MSDSITSRVMYLGQLRTEGTHIASGAKIITDAPLDNHGKGEAFSPTDLVATALANCMVTIMGIKAEDLGADLIGMSVDVKKIMQANPRRVAEIILTLHMPESLDERSRKLLEAAAHTCPVAFCLHPDIVQNITFSYDK